MERQTVIFLGPQGCGKGTQAKLLSDFLTQNDPSRPIIFFEAGQQLRDFGAQGGYTQGRVDTSLKRGELQPDFITTYLMSKLFIERIAGNEHVLVDGFPRLLPQLAMFETAITFYDMQPALVYIAISDEESVRRLKARGRNDDGEENIRKRLTWSKERVMPTIERMRGNPQFRYIEVNGEEPVENVHADILQKLGLQ